MGVIWEHTCAVPGLSRNVVCPACEERALKDLTRTVQLPLPGMAKKQLRKRVARG